jgi:hypothetical protein
MSGLEWTPDVSIYRQPWRESTGACLQAPAGEGITMYDRIYDCCEHCEHGINDPPQLMRCPEGCGDSGDDDDD